MKGKHNGNEKVHVTETPDVSHIRNLDVTHEAGDVAVGSIAKFIGGLTIMTIAVYFLMWGMFRLLNAQQEEEPVSPMALSQKERLPPEPRLQSAPGFAEELDKHNAVAEEGHAPVKGEETPKDPLWEIKVLREQWKTALEHGVKDPTGKVLVMPIEEAKKELLRQGLPVRQ
ncbi:MAG TPA: hypothetical protein VN643_25865 [Pyrinomonadaceae bacterium]|nr:hypothetical protein [Pyrinomonadaceae bacterium]